MARPAGRAHALRDLSWKVRHAIADIASMEMTAGELLDQLQTWQWPKEDESNDIPKTVSWLLDLQRELEARRAGSNSGHLLASETPAQIDLEEFIESIKRDEAVG